MAMHTEERSCGEAEGTSEEVNLLHGDRGLIEEAASVFAYSTHAVRADLGALPASIVRRPMY